MRYFSSSTPPFLSHFWTFQHVWHVHNPPSTQISIWLTSIWESRVFIDPLIANEGSIEATGLRPPRKNLLETDPVWTYQPFIENIQASPTVSDHLALQTSFAQNLSAKHCGAPPRKPHQLSGPGTRFQTHCRVPPSSFHRIRSQTRNAQRILRASNRRQPIWRLVTLTEASSSPPSWHVLSLEQMTPNTW
jgi:hypothetical protein